MGFIDAQNHSKQNAENNKADSEVEKEGGCGRLRASDSVLTPDPRHQCGQAQLGRKLHEDEHTECHQAAISNQET